MDPLSVAAFAITGGKILKSTAKLLDKFIHATREQDRTIQILQGLSEGLSKRLEDLSTALESDVLRRQENEDLWTGVYDAMRSCRGTIDDIDRKLEPLKNANAETGNSAIVAAWRAFRLQVPQPEIDSLVSQMRAHSTNLQLTLQTMNTIIAASIPGAITADLVPRFGRLERMIGTLRPYLYPPAGQDLPRISATPTALKVNENTNLLYFSALSLIDGSLGSTVRSTASESHFGNIPLQEEPPAFEDLEPTQELRAVASTSEAGVPLNETERNHIGNWIERAPAAQPAEMHHSDATGSENDSDADSINLLAFNMAKGAFARGMKFYHQQKFSDARAYLKLGIDKSTPLSDEQKNRLNLPSMQFHHALSCIVESSLLPEAEKSFRLVVERKGSQKADAHLQCLALYQLARVQLRIGKFDSARKYCERAVTRMEKDPAIGDGHPEHIDAVYLLALISWADGDKPLAWVCSDLLPPERQIADDDAFDAELALMIDNKENPAHSESETVSATLNGLPAPSWPLPPVQIVTEPKEEENIPIVATKEEDETRTPIEEAKRASRSPSTATSQFERIISYRPSSQHSSAVSVSRELPSPASTGPPDTPTFKATDDCSGAHQTINAKKFRGKDGVIKGLCWAAENCRLDVLEVLLADAHADVNAHKASTFRSHDTPLMIAAEQGHQSICKRLLQANASVNLVSRKRTALICAVSMNKAGVCQLLLEHGASPDWIEGQDMSPLSMAVRHGNKALCKLLADSNADVDETQMHVATGLHTAMMHAARKNSLKMLTWLLDHGADPDGPASSTIITTPLIEAARNHSIDACRLLLERNASPKLQTSRGKAASRETADKWLRRFVEQWPDSREWPKPESGMTVQP